MKAVMSEEVREIIQTAEGRKKLIDETLNLAKKRGTSNADVSIVEISGKQYQISLVPEKDRD